MAATTKRAAAAPAPKKKSVRRGRPHDAGSNASDLASEESVDEAERLFLMDEGFAFAHGGDEPGTADVVYDPLDELAAIPTLKGHRDAIRAIAFDEATNTLFTASWDETVLVWDLIKVEHIAVMPHGTWVNAVVVSRGGDGGLKVVTGAEDGNITVWQPTLTAHGQEYLVVGQWKPSHAAVACMCLHEQMTVFAGLLDRVAAFNLASGSVTRFYKADADVNHLLATDELLYCACDDGRVISFDIVGGFALRQLSGHTGPVRQIVVAEAYNTLYTAGDDGTIRVWLLSTGQCTKTWRVHKKPITCLAIHVGTRDRFLYSGSTDGIVCCTRLVTGTSFVARHCTATAMMACDLIDPEEALRRREEKRQSLTPAAIAAANLRAGPGGMGHLRRRSLLEVSRHPSTAESPASNGRLICADYRGHLYAYPTANTEAAVSMIDIQRATAPRHV
jgi:hypothetical protein